MTTDTLKKIFSGFVYLDIKHSLVAWECYRGALISPYVIDSLEAYHPSLRVANIIRASNNITLANELLFEYVRKKEFSPKVSRLRCFYAFPDKKLAKAAKKWGEHFGSQENLVKTKIKATNITMADANWVTNFKQTKNNLLDKVPLDSIRKYWSGTHWEYLVEGRAIIYGTEVRKRSYQIIKNSMLPNVLELLEISRIAETVESNLGHICPYITRISDTAFKLAYIMDMQDANNPSFLGKLKENKMLVNFNDLKPIDPINFMIPDLRCYEKIFSLSGFNLYDFSGMRIHTN